MYTQEKNCFFVVYDHKRICSRPAEHDNGLLKNAITCNREVIAKAIQRYDALWAEWKVLKESGKYCATIYTYKAFRNERKGSIGELADAMRNPGQIILYSFMHMHLRQ